MKKSNSLVMRLLLKHAQEIAKKQKSKPSEGYMIPLFEETDEETNVRYQAAHVHNVRMHEKPFINVIAFRAVKAEDDRCFIDDKGEKK